MASVQVNFPLLEQGATYAFGLCWGVHAVNAAGVPILDRDGNQTTAPYDLTACTARMQFRLKQATPVLMTATSLAGDIVLGGPSPVAVISSVVATSVLTVNATAHGLIVGDVVRLQGTVGHDGFYKVATVPDADHWTAATTLSNGSSTSGTIVLCGVDNISVTLADELTDLLTFKSCVHDLKVYWIGGQEDYVIHGSGTVRLRVTEDLA